MSPVFVVTLQGRETAGGPRLTALVFAAAADEAAAGAGAEAELARLGWTAVEVLRAGEITDRGALPADFEAAYATALKWGCGVIVYEG